MRPRFYFQYVTKDGSTVNLSSGHLRAVRRDHNGRVFVCYGCIVDDVHPDYRDKVWTWIEEQRRKGDNTR